MTDPNTQENPSQEEQIIKLRDIIFGDAKRDLETRVNHLEKDLFNKLSALEKQSLSRFNEAQKNLDMSIKKLESMMKDIDKAHIEREETLDAHLTDTQSQLENLAKVTKNESDDIVEQLHSQANLLTREFTQLHQEALEQLKQVSESLDYDKTDRKTLAKLLKDVANNLEQDAQDE